MLYNGVLVSAVSKSESAIRIHISPYPLPLASPFHPPYPTRCLQFFICLWFTFLNIAYQVLFFFWPHCMACGILVPQPGIKPVPPAVEVQSPNHWTTREVPPSVISKHITLLCSSSTYQRVKTTCFQFSYLFMNGTTHSQYSVSIS